MVQSNIEGLTVPGQHGPRPVVTDEMKLAAAMPIAKQMLSSKSDDVQPEAETIAKHGHLWGDGYELGKALESDGWDIRRDDIDTLDMYSCELLSLLEKAENDWEEGNDIQPPYPIGTVIKEGTITGIYQHGAAKYLVKKHGQIHDNPRLVIKFEDAVPLETAERKRK